jgi:hypothetical protein
MELAAFLNITGRREFRALHRRNIADIPTKLAVNQR